MTWQSLANQVGEGITGGGAGATVEAVEGADGTTFDVPDTPENTQRIGRPGSGRAAAQGDLASFPQARVVAVYYRTNLTFR